MHQRSVIEAKRNAGFSIRSLSVLKMLVGVTVVGVLINIDGSAHRMWEGGGRLLRHHNQRNMCDSCYLPVVDAPMIPFDGTLHKIRAHGVVVFVRVCYVTSVYALISVRDESFLSAFVVNAYRIGANRSPGLLFFRNLRWGGDSIREGLLFERGLYCFTCVLKVESTNTVFFSQFLHQIFTVFHSFFSQKLKKLVQNTSMYTKKVQEKNQENVSAKKSCSFKKKHQCTRKKVQENNQENVSAVVALINAINITHHCHRCRLA